MKKTLKPLKGFVVTFDNQTILQCSFHPIKKHCIYGFISTWANREMEWKELQSKGYRCVPATIIIRKQS